MNATEHPRNRFNFSPPTRPRYRSFLRRCQRNLGTCPCLRIQRHRKASPLFLCRTVSPKPEEGSGRRPPVMDSLDGILGSLIRASDSQSVRQRSGDLSLPQQEGGNILILSDCILELVSGSRAISMLKKGQQSRRIQCARQNVLRKLF